jgi:hypothetical protein
MFSVETPATAVISVEPYDKADLTGHATTASGSVILVVGSEYGKGQILQWYYWSCGCIQERL